MAATSLQAFAPAAAPAEAATTSSTTSSADGGLFIPSSGKLMDTRNGTGGYSTPMVANGWRTISPLGTNGIPTTGVSAVQVTLVAISPTTNGAVQVRPTGSTPPVTTSLYYSSTITGSQTNTTIVALGANGTFEVRTDTAINLAMEVEGYFTSGNTAAGGFVSLSPSERIVNTRAGVGLPQAKLTSGSTSTVDVAGLSEVPADATAVFVNFEMLNSSALAGHIQPYATGTPRIAAGLSFPGTVNSSASATVPLGTGSSAGKMDVYVAGGPIDLLVNVIGYYTPGDSETGAMASSFTPGTSRLLSAYSVPANGTIDVAIAGQSGIPTLGSGLAAVALNLQVRQTTSTGGGHIAMWPDDADNPGTTVLNYQPNNVRSNFTTVEVGSGGGIKLFNGGTQPITVYLDLQGWYTVAPLMTEAEWNQLLADLAADGGTTAADGSVTYDFGPEGGGEMTFYPSTEFASDTSSTSWPGGPTTLQKIRAGWGGFSGPYISFGRNDQQNIRTAQSLYITGAICLASPVSCPAAMSILYLVDKYLGKKGLCPTSKPNLRLYLWNWKKIGCYN